MRGFRREGDAYVAEVDAAERQVLAAVVADVAQLLGAGRFEESRGTRVGGLLDGLRLSGEAVPPPDDAAVRRLLPDASRDDPEVAAEFRRLTEADLRGMKIDRLAALWDALAGPAGDEDVVAELVVRTGDASAMAATFTDLRLVLAERLGIVDDTDSEALYDLLDEVDDDAEDDADEDAAGVEDEGGFDPDDPATPLAVRRYLGSVYAALSWLQESLVGAMLAGLQHEREHGHGGEPHPAD